MGFLTDIVLDSRGRSSPDPKHRLVAPNLPAVNQVLAAPKEPEQRQVPVTSSARSTPEISREERKRKPVDRRSRAPNASPIPREVVAPSLSENTVNTERPKLALKSPVTRTAKQTSSKGARNNSGQRVLEQRSFVEHNSIIGGGSVAEKWEDSMRPSNPPIVQDSGKTFAESRTRRRQAGYITSADATTSRQDNNPSTAKQNEDRSAEIANSSDATPLPTDRESRSPSKGDRSHSVTDMPEIHAVEDSKESSPSIREKILTPNLKKEQPGFENTDESTETEPVHSLTLPHHIRPAQEERVRITDTHSAVDPEPDTGKNTDYSETPPPGVISSGEPSLQIGLIEVVVVAPPQAPAPVKGNNAVPDDVSSRRYLRRL